MNPVSARLLGQQLICPQFTSPHDVVAWMGAMQAQEYRLMRWAVAMRTRRPSARAFEKDYNEGRIVRGHLFRTTWQLVAGEDWRWMLELCRPAALRGLAGWMQSNGVSIPQAEQDAIQLIFSDYLSKHRIAQKAGFAAALADKGIMMDEFDMGLHTRLADFILDLIHASDRSQLLFTSHNTNLIDVKRLRRDQIVFVNKSGHGATEVYSLYDFKDFRENMDAEKAYIQGRFDAVPYVESSVSIIKNLLEG